MKIDVAMDNSIIKMKNDMYSGSKAFLRGVSQKPFSGQKFH